jgi:hypothetical protein
MTGQFLMACAMHWRDSSLVGFTTTTYPCLKTSNFSLASMSLMRLAYVPVCRTHMPPSTYSLFTNVMNFDKCSAKAIGSRSRLSNSRTNLAASSARSASMASKSHVGPCNCCKIVMAQLLRSAFVGAVTSSPRVINIVSAYITNRVSGRSFDEKRCGAKSKLLTAVMMPSRAFASNRSANLDDDRKNLATSPTIVVVIRCACSFACHAVLMAPCAACAEHLMTKHMFGNASATNRPANCSFAAPSGQNTRTRRRTFS